MANNISLRTYSPVSRCQRMSERMGNQLSVENREQRNLGDVLLDVTGELLF